MEQTIQIGDRVLVDKFTPWFGSKPTRGDVVVFKDPGGWLEDEQTTAKSEDPIVVKQVKEGLTFIGLLPSDDEKDLIKRVVAVGGDTVKCCDAQGRVTVNGMPLNETPTSTPATSPPVHLRGEGPPGAAVGDGRPPGQLRRLPLPPHTRPTAAPSPRTPSSAGPWSSPGRSATGRSLEEPDTFSSVPDAGRGDRRSARRIGWPPRIERNDPAPEPCGTPARYGSGGPASHVARAAARSEEWMWGIWRSAHGPDTTVPRSTGAPRGAAAPAADGRRDLRE